MDVFKGYDLIVDGTDNFATRYMVNDAAYFLEASPTSGARSTASTARPRSSRPSMADDAPCYRCLYPEPPPPGMVPSCAEGGVLGVLCASIGSIQVNEAIKLLTGIGEPAGRQAGDLRRPGDGVAQAQGPQGPQLRAVRRATRPSPSLIDYEAFCGAISDEAAEAAAGSTISVIQLEHMLKEREEGTRDFVLVDVREPNEYEINQIPGSVLIPKGDFLNGTALEQLPGGQADRHALQVGRALGRDAGDRQGRGVRRRRARRRRRGGLGQPDRPQPADVLR